MFTKLNQLKFELSLIAILILTLSFFAWSYLQKDEVIGDLKETAVVQKIENAGLKVQVLDREASAVITETVNVQVKKESDALREKKESVQSKVDSKVAKIEHVYKQLPATPENRAAKDVAKNAAISEGMWETYCAVKPDAEGCSNKKD